MFGNLSFNKSSIWIPGSKIAVYQIRQNTFNLNSTLGPSISMHIDKKTQNLYQKSRFKNDHIDKHISRLL